MDEIEAESLYDERVDVSWARPLLQGDVFDDVVLPGFGDEPTMVQIVTHPCAMRKGPAMVERVTVAPVKPNARVAGQKGWDGNLRIMPLPELADGKNYATRFVDITAAPADLLTRDRRVASLSHKGIYVLQQRLIKHYTRIDIELDLLRRESAPILEEAQQQWDWVDEVLDEAELTDSVAVEAEAKVFDDWLGEGNPSRRVLLQDEVNHTAIRKQATRAARRRASSRSI